MALSVLKAKLIREQRSLLPFEAVKRFFPSSLLPFFHCSLNAFTGFADAARTTWKLTVASVITEASKAEKKNVCHSLISSMRYAKFCNHASVRYHANGKDMIVPIPTRRKNSFETK